LQKRAVQKQVAYLYTLFQISRDSGLLAAMPFLPVVE
jgi:hypothetical protein